MSCFPCSPLAAALVLCAGLSAHGAEPAAPADPTPLSPDRSDAPQAQELDRIVVTASRAGTALEDLPVSVSVVGEEDLQAQLVQDRNVLAALNPRCPGCR